MQVLTMVTLSFTFAGALAGLMGMNLYFAVAETPLVSMVTLNLCQYSCIHGTATTAISPGDGVQYLVLLEAH